MLVANGLPMIAGGRYVAECLESQSIHAQLLDWIGHRLGPTCFKARS